MQWLLGQRPVSVFAEEVRGPIYERYGVGDGIWTLVRFDDGAVACDEAFWTLPSVDMDWEEAQETGDFFGGVDYRVELLGSAGAGYLEYPPTELRMHTTNGWRFPDTRIAPVVYGRVAGALREELTEFGSRIRDGRGATDALRQARTAVDIGLAAQRSLKLGQPVAISGRVDD